MHLHTGAHLSVRPGQCDRWLCYTSRHTTPRAIHAYDSSRGQIRAVQVAPTYYLHVLGSPGNVQRVVAAPRAGELRESTREPIGRHGLAGDKVAGR
jgi:hypothetical protein